jgi:hypothetical protein
MEKSDWEKRRERYSFITAKGTKKDCNYTEEDLEDAKKEAFRQGQIDTLNKIKEYVENDLALLGISHGINEMKGSWINKEDLLEYLKDLEK